MDMEKAERDPEAQSDMLDSNPTPGDLILGKCAVCSKPCEKTCVKCREVSYCSKEHQLSHWKSKHKFNCAPVKIDPDPRSPGKRLLVATRDIPRGEIIFKEKPLLSGPREDDNAGWRFPLCLNCYRLMPNGGWYHCSKCRWTVCSPACEQGQIHSQLECSIFAQAHVEPARNLNDYLGLHFLRAALIIKKDPNFLERIQQLDLYNGDKHSEDELIDMYRFLLAVLKRRGLAEGLDFETFKTIYGAIIENRISDDPIRIGDQSDDGQPIGSFLYFKATFLSHSCVPNSQYFIQANHQLWLRASVPIQKGELVTVSKIDLDYFTSMRREILKSDYGIDCNCLRCRDPTELGTFMGGIKCKAHGCADFYLPINPLDSNTLWKCHSPNCCSTPLTSDQIFEIQEKVSEEFAQIQTKYGQLGIGNVQAHLCELKEQEKFIRKYEGKVVHPNHFLLFVAKKSVVLLIPKMASFIAKDTDRMEFLQRQVEWTRQCLGLVDQFWPGLTRYRGQLLYCLQSGLLTLMVTEIEKFQKGKRSRGYIEERMNKFQEVFAEIVKFRNEIKEIFSIERDGKFERNFLTELEGEEDWFQMAENITRRQFPN